MRLRSRLDFPALAPEVYQAFIAADTALRKSPLGATVRELVKIRASQLNGCVFCVDLHTREARELGESEDRIFQLPVWRESPLFSEAERAALAYADAATRLTGEGVSDAVWDEAAGHFGPEELAALVGEVALINTLNRIGVPLRTQPPAR